MGTLRAFNDSGAWRLHWLRAAGDLGPWEAAVTDRIAAAHADVANYVSPKALDILVERGTAGVRDDLGFGFHIPRSDRVTLMIDPENPAWETAPAGDVLRRQAVNAWFKGARMAGPGLGFTLGGAVVGEGLAGLFVRLTCGSAAEPWDTWNDATMAPHWPDRRALMATRFDRGAWFFGEGDMPANLGYAVGARLAEAWLTSGAEVNAERLIAVPTPKVLAASIEAPVALPPTG